MKVCFVLLYSYPLFEPAVETVFGGSEVRGWLLARGLARKPGCDISVVVLDHGQPRVRDIDGIHVYAHTGYRCREQSEQTSGQTARWRGSIRAGVRLIPGLAPARRRIGSLVRGVRMAVDLARGRAALVDGEVVNECRWAVYREVGADVCCVFGVSDLSAEVVGFCRRFGKKAVILAGSDIDFSEQYHANLYGSRAHLCHYAVAQADAIVVQTNRQAQLLRERFGREGVCLSNPVDLDARVNVPEASRFALWVGKADNIKRPELCLELARRCPEIPFVMIMNQSDPQIFSSMVEHCPANVRMVERVAFADVERYFAAAAVLVNTSAFEGFPNAFLQAGKYSVPLASLQVDPDGFIGRQQCGIAAHGDMDLLTEGVRLIWSRGTQAHAWARNIEAYVRRNHNLADAVAVLEGVLNGGSCRAAA